VSVVRARRTVKATSSKDKLLTRAPSSAAGMTVAPV